MQRLAALLWLLCLGAVSVHQWQFWREARLDANVLALLPQDEHDELLVAANDRLAADGERRVVVLVGTADAGRARQLAAATREALLADAAVLRAAPDAQGDIAGLIAWLQPWRDRLLTTAQREALAHADVDALAEHALAQLMQPLAQPRLTAWSQDPLSLWPEWWRERARVTRAQRDGEALVVQAQGRLWTVLEFDAVSGAFTASGATPIHQRLAAAREALHALDHDAELLAAGVPLHAERAAAQASLEVNTIGWGSLLAVLLLVWMTFRSLRPIALIALSLIVGCAVALSITAMLFGQVHLLTLVFGASLVGVAEDYGFHWFAARQGQPDRSPRSLLQQLLPGLTLALATSVVAYLALGLAPFPGLRQMAVFSASGLLAAFLTVVCLFPLIDGHAPVRTRFSERCAASLAAWPRWQSNRTGWIVAAALLLFVAGGMWRLQSRDDLRQLHAAPPDLVAMQARIDALLGLPSPAQYFLVIGDSADQVLQREESLGARLDGVIARGQLSAWQALSQWLPSALRQEENARLSGDLEHAVITRINALIDESLQRGQFATNPLRVDDLLAQPQGRLLARTWLGVVQGRQASVVLLHGVQSAQLATIAAAADGIDGVRFVDRTATISELLARYRVGIGGLLVAGYCGVLLLLVWRYRGAAWRALTPTLIGSLLTLAIFGWAGWPLQLFGVLALLLLLGMGVDYGIFLLEHPGDGAAWLAVALAGISTLLAFGLLALSATPALHAFGLTMLIGELSIWLITPCLRPQPPTSH